MSPHVSLRLSPYGGSGGPRVCPSHGGVPPGLSPALEGSAPPPPPPRAVPAYGGPSSGGGHRLVPWGFLGSSELPFPLRFPSSSPPSCPPPYGRWETPGLFLEWGSWLGVGGGVLRSVLLMGSWEWGGVRVCPCSGVLGGSSGISLHWGSGGVPRSVPAMGHWGGRGGSSGLPLHLGSGVEGVPEVYPIGIPGSVPAMNGVLRWGVPMSVPAVGSWRGGGSLNMALHWGSWEGGGGGAVPGSVLAVGSWGGSLGLFHGGPRLYPCNGALEGVGGGVGVPGESLI